MHPHLKDLYGSVKKRVDYGKWGKFAKYTIARGCKTPGELFIVYRLEGDIVVVTLISKSNRFYIDDVDVSLTDVCVEIIAAILAIEKHRRAESYRKSVEGRNTVVIDELDFHRQRDLAARNPFVRHHTTNPQKW